MKTVELKLSDIAKNPEQFNRTEQVAVFAANDLQEALETVKQGWQTLSVFRDAYKVQPARSMLDVVMREKRAIVLSFGEEYSLEHLKYMKETFYKLKEKIDRSDVRYLIDDDMIRLYVQIGSKACDDAIKENLHIVYKFEDYLAALFYAETGLTIDYDSKIDSYVPAFNGIINAAHHTSLIGAIRELTEHDKLVDLIIQYYVENGRPEVVNESETFLRPAYSGYIIGFHLGKTIDISECELLGGQRIKYAVLRSDVCQPDLSQPVYVIEKDIELYEL